MNSVMRKSFLLLLCGVVCTAAAQQAQIGAIGYVVTNIDRSQAFYTEVLGMLPAGDFALDSTWSREAGAASGRPFSVRQFRLGDGPGTTVLKLAYFGGSQPRPSQQGLDSPAGVNYLTLTYPDLAPVVARLKKAGIPILGTVQRDSYQLVFIRDPDGLFVELVGPPDPAGTDD